MLKGLVTLRLDIMELGSGRSGSLSPSIKLVRNRATGLTSPSLSEPHVF